MRIAIVGGGGEEEGAEIEELAARRGLVVEAGYQRRYDPAWEEIRRLISEGALGEPIMAVSMALFRADPRTWYYDQEASGGMPLTHLSYCYLNAMRWILGRPTVVSAMASKKVETGLERVSEGVGDEHAVWHDQRGAHGRTLSGPSGRFAGATLTAKVGASALASGG